MVPAIVVVVVVVEEVFGVVAVKEVSGQSSKTTACSLGEGRDGRLRQEQEVLACWAEEFRVCSIVCCFLQA